VAGRVAWPAAPHAAMNENITAHFIISDCWK
jgi:hypothetical protein